MKPDIKPGTICMVRIRSSKWEGNALKHKPGRLARRVFKWTEKRFGEILCYVFSSPCRADVKVKVETMQDNAIHLTISGPKVPCSEVSVPHYDLIHCEPI